MNAPRRRTAICIAVVSLAAVTAGGCRLDRSILPPGWPSVTPVRYCPADTLTASYDFLREETCRSPEACAMHQPTVTVTGEPADFPARSVAGYADSFSFVPSGDRVQLNYTPDRNAVRIPTSRTDAEGHPIDVIREGVNPERLYPTRIDGSLDNELVHDGMCAGSTPTHASARRWSAPVFSPNLRISELCNLNGVAVIVTLSETASGVVTERMLAPRECFSPLEPGAIGGGETARTVSVRTLVPDLGARCSALGPNTPPAPLRTLARLSCG